MSDDYTVHNADCLDAMKAMEPDSVDSIVTDPPYGLSFMGKNWDHGVPGVEFWREAIRVLKPGGHILAFGGTRTHHRLTCAIEDAGFEIRDELSWVYGQGFPKSMDVSKAIDKAAGESPEIIGWKKVGIKDGAAGGSHSSGLKSVTAPVTAPVTAHAKEWDGWGTALKPAVEPIILARKPLIGTVAANVLAHGTGALNIDGTRIGTRTKSTGVLVSGNVAMSGGNYGREPCGETIGRWPANLLHDGSDEVMEAFSAFWESKSRPTKDGKAYPSENTIGLGLKDLRRPFHIDEGSPARFFYCAKASKKDRDEGLDDLPLQAAGTLDGTLDGTLHGGQVPQRRNIHPTVKPTDLMRWCCRLITPPGGLVLDPFTGSGSTGKAAILEGFRFVGCEKEAEYAEIARKRIAAAVASRAKSA